MPDPQQVDYDALAKQNGALSSVPGPQPTTMNSRAKAASFATKIPAPPVASTPAAPSAAPSGDMDYDALAKQNGALSSTPAAPAASPTTEPEDKAGFLERAYQTSPLKGIIDAAKAKGDADDAARKEISDHLKNGRWGHAAEAILKHVVAPAAKEAVMGPGGDFLSGVAQNTYKHGKAAIEAIGQGDTGEAIAQGAEAVPVVGSVAEQIGEPLGKDLHDKNYGGVAGDVVGGGTSLALLKGGKKSAEGLAGAFEGSEAAVPKEPVIAGTKLPETVGQSASRANPTGIGSDIKGVEDVAARLPASGKLRAIGESQQGAAREVLANKAAKTGAETSTAPEAIEQNATAAAGKAREAGTAKYQAIGEAAKDADMGKTIDTAHSILGDETLAKVLPRSAKDALGKVGESLEERESIAKQIYGKPFNDLDAAKQTEVGKALSGGEKTGTDFEAIQKARSELADAAHGMKDPADRFQAHKALDSFDQAIEDSLKAHDAKNGTSLSSDLGEAKQLWSQKYAYEEFRDGLQDMMRDQPHTGHRLINGQSFQKLINDLDPRGSTGKTPLQRMFPDDPQSVKDIHELADFMGKNQGHAGGMTTGMAKLRMLGLKESALGLMANTSGFSYLMSKPGMARAALTAIKSGFYGTKAAGAVATLNHAADDLSQRDKETLSDRQNPQNSQDKNEATEPSTALTDADTNQSATITKGTAAKNSATPAANSKPNPITPSAKNAIPPASLWQGKENKRLTLKGPDGNSQRWELNNGKPRRVD